MYEKDRDDADSQTRPFRSKWREARSPRPPIRSLPTQTILVPTRHPKLHHVVAVLRRDGHFLDILHEIIA